MKEDKHTVIYHSDHVVSNSDPSIPSDGGERQVYGNG